MTTVVKKKTHTFTILLEGKHDFETIAERIYESCDDVLVSECRGVIAIDFSRDNDTFVDAMLSALLQLFDMGFQVSRVEPDDLVNENEIARRIDQSRQSVAQYISGVRGPGDFPVPVANVTGKRPLWHWHQVLKWLYDNNIWGTQCDIDRSEPIAIANAALELLRHKDIQRIFQTLRDKSDKAA